MVGVVSEVVERAEESEAAGRVGKGLAGSYKYETVLFILHRA